MKTTAAFRSYWYLAAERQAMLIKRLAGQPAPWTEDPILQAHRFTNAYRVEDRVSQYLLRKVLYRPLVYGGSGIKFSDGDGSEVELASRASHPTTAFFRTVLFKLFNLPETWDAMDNALHFNGTQDTFVRDSPEAGTLWRELRAVLEARQKRISIYNAAYVMPSFTCVTNVSKAASHLELLQAMLRRNLPETLADCKSLERAYTMLSEWPMMGPFLTMQYLTDLNYSGAFNWPEDFIVPGPGAVRGIRKCFEGGKNGWPEGCSTEADVIKYMRDNQDRYFEQFALSFQRLYVRPLQLIDCQNIFCEVDKYARVAHPELSAGESAPKRIKQKFEPDPRPLEPMVVPPKWLKS